MARRSPSAEDEEIIDTAHDPGGWHNWCNRRLIDGTFCLRRYWYAYSPSTRMGKRMEDRESGKAHVCREVVKD